MIYEWFITWNLPSFGIPLTGPPRVSGKVTRWSMAIFTFRTCFVEAKENGAKKPPMVGGSMCQSLDELCVFCRYPVVLLEPHEYRDSWLDLWSLDVFRSSIKTKPVLYLIKTLPPPSPKSSKKIIILKGNYSSNHLLSGDIRWFSTVTWPMAFASWPEAKWQRDRLVRLNQVDLYVTFWKGDNCWIEMRKNPWFF